MIIYTSNIPEIVDIFSKFEKKTRNKRGILEPLAKKEKARTQQRLASTKIDPFGTSWVPWASSTADQRARKGNLASGLLFDTGNLYRSIDYNVTGDSFSVGTNVDYAEYHQFGTEHIPSREFLGFNKQIEQDVEWVFKTIFDPRS